jgi:hypothetical protein
LEGYIDRIRAGRVEGWVWDSARPDEPVAVAALSSDGAVLALSLADLYRGDVHRAGKGNGAHGFSMVLPEAAVAGPTTLHIVTIGKTYELLGSPIVLGEPSNLPTRARDAIADRAIFLGAVEARLGEIGAALGARERAIEDSLRDLAKRRGLVATEGGVAATRLADVLVLPPIDWHYRLQRPQQLAAALARQGRRVFYVAPQFLPPSAAAPFVIHEEPERGVFLVRLRLDLPHPEVGTAPPGPRCLEEVVVDLTALGEACGIRRPLVLVGWPAWQGAVQAFSDAFIVYDRMDWVAGFRSISNELIATESKLADTAHLLIASSAPLCRELADSTGREVQLLRNATTLEMFSVPPPPEGGIPVVGYIGAIEHWFDLELACTVCRSMPDVQFLFVGNVAPENAALAQIPNARCIGERPRSELAALLAQTHATWIPFRRCPLVDHTNPVKIYECLAAGRAVVAPPMPELEAFNGEVLIADGPEEFVGRLREALLTCRDVVRIRQRRAAVATESWDCRASLLVAAALGSGHWSTQADESRAITSSTIAEAT